MENTVKKTKAMYFAELREMVLAAVEDQAQQDGLSSLISRSRLLKSVRLPLLSVQRRRRLSLML